jgi:hypothetical protein
MSKVPNPGCSVGREQDERPPAPGYAAISASGKEDSTHLKLTCETGTEVDKKKAAVPLCDDVSAVDTVTSIDGPSKTLNSAAL